MNQHKQAQQAISTLLELTKDDPDLVSCLTLGEDWDSARGTVFVVKNVGTARTLFKFLLVQGLVSERPVLKRKEHAR